MSPSEWWGMDADWYGEIVALREEWEREGAIARTQTSKPGQGGQAAGVTHEVYEETG